MFVEQNERRTSQGGYRLQACHGLVFDVHTTQILDWTQLRQPEIKRLRQSYYQTSIDLGASQTTQ